MFIEKRYIVCISLFKYAICVMYHRISSIPTSSSVAPPCASCASWRNLSCWSPSCQRSVPVWSIVTAMYAAMQSWPSTPSTGAQARNKHQKRLYICVYIYIYIYVCVCMFYYYNNYYDLFFCLIRNFEHLIPDAPELIHDFLVNEKDSSCKRNAFMMLIHADQVHSLITVLQIMFLSARMGTSWNYILVLLIITTG